MSALEIVPIGDLPLYNEDEETATPPAAWQTFRDRVRRADAILFATPEYNHGVPGVLKNAIDWLSRPPRASALDGKVAAIMGASPGMTGTLTLRYERNTPLGDCSAEAWIDRVEGVKTIVKGEMRDAEGTTTARAEGIFILPRWAREAMAKDNRKPPRF